MKIKSAMRSQRDRRQARRAADRQRKALAEPNSYFIEAGAVERMLQRHLDEDSLEIRSLMAIRTSIG